jgi:hypothetical protein
LVQGQGIFSVPFGAEKQTIGPILNSIWQQCITCLEGEISEQQLNTWILPLQVEQELNTLKLLAPNRFVMDWVRKHFLEQIGRASCRERV